MTNQYIEMISEDKSILSIIQFLIDSRVLGKIEISDTKHSWITMILEVKNIGNSFFLSMDRIEGLESTLSDYPNREVSLEFMDKGGVPCRFRTKVIECRLNDILLELPKEILRIQRRQFFRIKALPGTKITFHMGPSEEEKAKVENLSVGGVAFIIEKKLKFGLGDLLNNIDLDIPERIEWLRFHILQTVVRRIENPSLHKGRTLCAIELLELPKKTRDNLIAYISKQQMVMIQKVKG
ncbi:MAG: PilZ domain-containing protein [Desulfobacterales bacterium]|nr:PilZ domain-containing protein [Desulfobacterales bacterium]